jgi:hypothetical protein
MEQGLDDAIVSSKTNAKGTTVTTVSKSTVSNSVIQAADLLKLLENSLATNFPEGSKLVVSRFEDDLIPWIADSSGTNVIGFLSPTFFIGTLPGARVHAGSQTLTSNSGGSAYSTSGALAETFTEIVGVGYDDTKLSTRDGTHTKFFMMGELVQKSSENLSNQHLTDNIKIQAFGNGTVRDHTVILDLNASANISGVTSP